MKRSALVLIALLIGFTLALVTSAQEASVTYDDMIRVASKMYCPICENEPLDECRNPTCIEWKEEIRQQLEAGRSDEEIIRYFVDTYGQHVVGIPQDPLLRLLSFIAPVIGTILAIGIGVLTFWRWQHNTPAEISSENDTDEKLVEDSEYRSRLERDLE